MSNDFVLPHERVDDLQLNGLRLIQNPSGFCFGIDAVLLSDFAKGSVKKNSRVLDLFRYFFRQRLLRRTYAGLRFSRRSRKWRSGAYALTDLKKKSA